MLRFVVSALLCMSLWGCEKPDNLDTYRLVKQYYILNNLSLQSADYQRSLSNFWAGKTDTQKELSSLENVIEIALGELIVSDCADQGDFAVLQDSVTRLKASWRIAISKSKEPDRSDTRRETLLSALAQLDHDIMQYMSHIKNQAEVVAALKGDRETPRTLNLLNDLILINSNVRLNIRDLRSQGVYTQDLVRTLLKNAYSMRRKLDTLLDGNKQFNVAAVKNKAIRGVLTYLRDRYDSLKIEALDDVFHKSGEQSEQQKLAQQTLVEIHQSTKDAVEQVHAIMERQLESPAVFNSPLCGVEEPAPAWLEWLNLKLSVTH